jgi:hypothetical protein
MFASGEFHRSALKGECITFYGHYLVTLER